MTWPDAATLPACCACPMLGSKNVKERMTKTRRMIFCPQQVREPWPHSIRRETCFQRFFCPTPGIQRLGLSPPQGMCYNRRAVKSTGKQEMALAAARGVVVEASGGTAESSQESSSHRQEDASRYCPLCSQRLESRRCKLICNVCGYYMSCADYY